MTFRRVASKINFLRGVSLLAATNSSQGESLKSNSPALGKDETHTQLSPMECIKQACLHSVNSSSTLLTTTVDAIVDSSNRYKQALSALTTLLEESSYDNAWGNEIWDQVIQLRVEVSDCRDEFRRLLMYMENVEKVVEATVEAAFNANAEYICKTLCERSHSATVEVNKCKLEVEAMEQLYLKVQVYVATKQDEEIGDEEIPQETNNK